jgi:hypothetical protein
MFLGSKARPVLRADNLSAICESIVYKMWILNISQPYRPPRPVTGLEIREHRAIMYAAWFTEYADIIFFGQHKPVVYMQPRHRVSDAR